MNINLLRSAALCAIFMVMQALTGCGGGGGTTAVSSSARTYLGTQAPGDVWNWSLTSSTFSATNVTKSVTYSGGSTLLASGFYKLNCTTSSDPTSVGTTAYAFEVPGVALIAKPNGSNSDPIVGAASGSGPPAGTVGFNWINIPSQNWGQTNDAFGTAELTTSGAVTNIAITPYQLNGTANATGSQTLNYANGQLSSPDGTVNGVYTPAGVAILDEGAGRGGVVGVKQPTANVSLSDVLTHEFRGMLFKGGSGQQSQLVWARANGSGGLTGGSYTDVDNNVEDTTSGDNVTIAFTSQPSPGLVQGTITSNGQSTPMVFVVTQAGGKYMIFGFADDGGSPYNFLVCQK